MHLCRRTPEHRAQRSMPSMQVITKKASSARHSDVRCVRRDSSLGFRVQDSGLHQGWRYAPRQGRWSARCGSPGAPSGWASSPAASSQRGPAHTTSIAELLWHRHRPQTPVGRLLTAPNAICKCVTGAACKRQNSTRCGVLRSKGAPSDRQVRSNQHQLFTGPVRSDPHTME